MYSNKYYVYYHDFPNTDKIYIGKGTGNRVFSSNGRSSTWVDAAKAGFYPHILESDLTLEEALLLEESLIEDIGFDNLINNVCTGAYKKIDLDIVKKFLVYDTSSPSNLTWIVPVGKNLAGSAAGYLNTAGYWRVKLFGEGYQAHRLVWALFNGDPGFLVINHIDNNPSNNTIENLELCSIAENNNRTKLSKELRPDNTSGYTGIINTCNNGYNYSVARKYIEGKLYSKYFSHKKLGKYGAMEAAIEYLTTV